MCDFTHLHCHSQFSLLDGAASIPLMMEKAKADGMNAVAITDHGNMYGAFQFVAEANKKGIKPIVGCEFYLVEDRSIKSFSRSEKDQRFHQLLLAKNQKGYENISKLCSLGFVEGLYGKYPRIDKSILKQYKEGLIATSCCIGAEVPQAILHKGEEEAEKIFLEWLDIFGENYFIEIQRHNLQNIDNTGISQEDVNQILLKWAKKYDVKVIATNDSHYVEEEDWAAHDILLCVNTGEKLSTPKGDGKGFRFGFANNQFFFKSQQQMKELFKDVPQAIENTQLITEMITPPIMTRDILLPNFILPTEFKDQGAYLTHLTYEGAKKRYGILTLEIEERIQFELQTILNSGYMGYFLIVQDFTAVARNLGVSVGPGRGSAAGSAVAYCLGITNIDPIKYNLLFERFLNPERVSMPDIDIDFDDVGRDKVIDYVVKKYGKDHVAQIITYGSMAAKSSLKDVGRVMDIPLPEVEKVTKAFPDNAAASLRKILNPKGIDEKLKKEMKPEQMQQAENFIKLSKNDDVIGKMIRMAYKLEGSVRNTGIHACGVIITPEELNKYLPVTLGKDSDFLVTQFDNNAMEKSGLLKMDFLGLKTLTIIKNACQMIKENHGVEIIPDEIPLDDPKTYELFQKGATSGVFQFESPGMQKHLIALKPNKFEDLIAMNALYRPGPMAYIESFIKRKHGKEAIAYDLPIMSQYLEETYGITVYQEQVMLLSQLLANFTKGEADTLRKAMGKKQKEVLDKMKPRFIEGCAANGHDEKIVEKIWVDWEAFAEYAFNKSHATCYAYLAFHTAYLKANYPSEFMATVLSLNKDNIKDVNFFLSETKRMGIKTLVPDINESKSLFTVNKNGDIRFGLAGIKGVGGAAIDEIVLEREKNGIFNTFFDFTKRVNLRSINKRNLEAMAYAGAFDGFPNVHRAQFFHEGKEGNLVEKGIKYGNYFKEKAMNSLANLFGGSADENIQEPDLPVCDEWDIFKQLQLEKEYTGIYVSGHPLDDYAFEINKFGFGSINELTELKGKSLKIPVLISSVSTRMDAKNRTFAIVNVEDLEGSMEVRFFSEDYIKFGNYLKQGALLMLHGIYNNSKWNEDRYDFRVNEILHLGDLLDKKTKSLEVGLNFEDLDLELVIALEKTLKSYPGKKLCTLELTYFGEKETINFNSRSVLLDICKPLINELDQIPGVRVKIK
ncbi:MAG: DNA polymerase III subunit alpha [Bacteroidetes bacterium]|nr:DNA polymerase III subunit alpha [Bacteroidota bacterium]MBP7257471.1 DNA polymerase III subunit alpha [Chitinophagales bacterium]